MKSGNLDVWAIVKITPEGKEGRGILLLHTFFRWLLHVCPSVSIASTVNGLNIYQ